MTKEVLRSIDGVGLYPSITLVVFVLFFTTVFLWVLRLRRDQAETLAAMPLDDGEIHPTTTRTAEGETHHG